MKKTKLTVALLSAALAVSVIPSVVSAADENIVIDTTNFEDPNFVTYLKKIEKNTDNGYDADGAFSEDELLKLTSIKPGANVISLKGIEKLTHVTSVNINGNQNITSLDLSSNSEMKNVYATNSALEELNVAGCNKITKLDLTGSKITGLDISDCTNLNYLDVSNTGNSIKSICIVDQKKLVETAYDGNHELLTAADGTYKYHEFTMQVNSTTRTLKFDENTTLQVARIDENCFPGQAFRRYVENFDKDEDGYISWDEKNSVKSVHFVNQYESTLEGIEFFDKITRLVLYNNVLKELDVSKFTELTYLDVCYNHLESMDVSNNLKLETFLCYHNIISSLKFGDNTALDCIMCEFNELTEIDVTNLTALTELSVAHNSLDTLDISKNVNLEKLYCYNSNLSSLDTSNNTKLIEIDCNDNNISELDLSKNTDLYSLYCAGNNLSELDLSNNSQLDKLDCSSNNLKNVDLSNNNQITTFRCSSNDMSELDMSNLFNLRLLGCSDCNLTSLNLKGCKNLYNLDCSKNKLTSLNIGENILLESMNCDSNNLTKLDFTKNAYLQDVSCSANSISSFIFPDNSELQSLVCASNKLTSLDVSACKNLLNFNCSNNTIKNLDVSNNLFLNALLCSGNGLEKITFSPEMNQFYYLDCRSNNLESLDTSSFNELFYLYCYDNNIKEIDLSNSKFSNVAYTEERVDEKIGNGYHYRTYISGSNYLYVDLDTRVAGLSLYPLEPTPTPTNVPPKPTTAPGNTTTPTVAPTKVPTATPSKTPTAVPTVAPTGTPTTVPGGKPTTAPGVTTVPNATSAPEVTSRPNVTDVPGKPTSKPTTVPTGVPVVTPAGEEEAEPTKAPSVEDFAERLYTTCLGRDAEEAGKEYWVSELKAGKPGSEVAEGFFFSPEFIGFELDNEEYITRLYRTFMGREPDKAGIDYWSSEMDNGKDRKFVFDGFVNSPEWADICLTYGIRSGGLASPTFEKEASAKVIAFAERLYTTCLGRAAEKEGLEWWSAELANLRQTGTVAAQGFFYSPEFIGLKTSDDEYVTRLYRTFMGREPEEAGFEFWVSELKAGKSRDYVFDGFSVAPEFANLCADAGIMR